MSKFEDSFEKVALNLKSFKKIIPGPKKLAPVIDRRKKVIGKIKAISQGVPAKQTKAIQLANHMKLMKDKGVSKEKIQAVIAKKYAKNK